MRPLIDVCVFPQWQTSLYPRANFITWSPLLSFITSKCEMTVCLFLCCFSRPSVTEQLGRKTRSEVPGSLIWAASYIALAHKTSPEMRVFQAITARPRGFSFFSFVYPSSLLSGRLSPLWNMRSDRIWVIMRFPRDASDAKVGNRKGEAYCVHCNGSIT